MSRDLGRRRRRSIRLPGYDYGSPGAYFVTLCTRGWECVLDDPVVAGIVTDVWHALPGWFPTITLDEFVVMPNHVHLIVWLHPPVGATLAVAPNETVASGAGASPAPTAPNEAGVFGAGASPAPTTPDEAGVSGAGASPAPTTPDEAGVFGAGASPAPTAPDEAGVFGAGASPAPTAPNEAGVFGAGASPAPTAPNEAGVSGAGASPAPTTPNEAGVFGAGASPAPTPAHDAGATLAVAPTPGDDKPWTIPDPETINPNPALGDVIGAFKSLVFTVYRGWVQAHDPTRQAKFWQRNYYEHVVRNERELDAIRRYIRDNPAQWAFDRDNPANLHLLPPPQGVTDYLMDVQVTSNGWDEE